MKRTTITLLLAMAAFTSCKFISLEDFETPEYYGDFTWTKVVENASWSNRFDHAAVSYQNKLWVIGGYNPGQVKGDPYLEDVWSSADGKTWELVQADAPWKGRRGHTVTVFDDGTGEAMFLAGGFSVDETTGYRQYNNDIWKSTDGANWQLLRDNCDWFPRMNHAVVVTGQGGQKYLYLMGGSSMTENSDARYSMKYFNDVWRSSDGIHWENMHSEDYGIRAGFAATADPATGTIYVQGGMYGEFFSDTGNLNQPLENWHWLWSSVDGQHWTSENKSDDFSSAYLFRAEHQMALYEDTLYVFPGKSNSNMHLQFAQTEFESIWKWGKNHVWSIDSNGSGINARYSYGFVEFDHKIWILGGETDTQGPSNDVWYAEIN